MPFLPNSVSRFPHFNKIPNITYLGSDSHIGLYALIVVSILLACREGQNKS